MSKQEVEVVGLVLAWLSPGVESTEVLTPVGPPQTVVFGYCPVELRDADGGVQTTERMEKLIQTGSKLAATVCRKLQPAASWIHAHEGIPEIVHKRLLEEQYKILDVASEEAAHHAARPASPIII